MKKLTFEKSIKMPMSPDSTALFRIDFSTSPQPVMLSMTLDREKLLTGLWFLPYDKWMEAIVR